MPHLAETLGGFIARRQAHALTQGDLSKHVWVAFQKALAHKGTPNCWELRVSPADAEALGGADALAHTCLALVASEWAEEGRLEQAEMQDVVLCQVDEGLQRGHAQVKGQALAERELMRKVIAARAAGLAVATGLVPVRPATYELVCPWDGSRVPVTGDLSLGRATTNDVVVPGQPYVSQVHGQLVRDEESTSGWSYIDLGSTNGSAVNGVAVTSKVALHAGDRIGLGGSCHVVFERIERAGGSHGIVAC